MIGNAIDKFPAHSLRWVLDAPIDEWHLGAFWPVSGGLCLYGHAFASSHIAAQAACGEFIDKARRFDRLWLRFGGARTVRACKIRALKALERHAPAASSVPLHAGAAQT